MPIPALIAAAGAIGSTLLGMRSSDRANAKSHKYDDLNALLAVKDFEFNKDYTLNQYQYTANDMSKAGINPLIMGSSAGSSSVSAGNVNTGSSSVADFSAIGNLASSVLSSKTQEFVADKSSDTQKSIADKSSDTQKSIAENNLEFNREKLKSDSEIRKQELEIERQNSQAQILKAQADVIKAQAETRNIDVNTADTSYELEGRKSKGSFKDDGTYTKDFKSALDFGLKTSPAGILYSAGKSAYSINSALNSFKSFSDKYSYTRSWSVKDVDNWISNYESKNGSLSDKERIFLRSAILKSLKR